MVKIESGGGTAFAGKITSKKNQAQLTRIVECCTDLIRVESRNKDGSLSQTWKSKLLLCLFLLPID